MKVCGFLQATDTILRTGNLWSRERSAAFLSRKSAKVFARAASDYASSVHHAAAAAGHVKVLRLLSQDSAPDEFVDEEGSRMSLGLSTERWMYGFTNGRTLLNEGKGDHRIIITNTW